MSGSTVRPIKAAWNRYATVPAAVPFGDVLTPEEMAAGIARVEASAHPAFQLAPGVFIEIPPTGWGHGDFLVYLPERHWMVRRNYADHWYIDIGIFKPFRDDLYGWTDLWLDVIAPEPAVRYHLLDANEFGQALRQGRVSAENAALAMESLHRLVTILRNNEFPVPEIRAAELFYEEYRKSSP